MFYDAPLCFLIVIKRTGKKLIPTATLREI